jgi:hypothetical protein
MHPTEVRQPTESPGEGIEGPYSLRIPRIGVHAPVVAIHSNEDRVLMPASDPSLVGWWSNGPAHGETEGSAVLVGHTVRHNGGRVSTTSAPAPRGHHRGQGMDTALTYRVQSIDVLPMFSSVSNGNVHILVMASRAEFA